MTYVIDKDREKQLLRKIKVDKKSPIYRSHIYFEAHEDHYSLDFYISVAELFAATTTKRPLSNTDVIIKSNMGYIRMLKIAAARNRKVKVSDYPMYFSAYDAKTDKYITYMTEDSLCEMLGIPYRYTEQTETTEAEQQKIKAKFGMAGDSSSPRKIDITNPLYHRVIVFAGTFPRGSSQNLKQTVRDLGGFTREYVSANVDYLVIGDTEYADTERRSPKTQEKIAKAEKHIKSGKTIKIISENMFNEMIAPYISQ